MKKRYTLLIALALCVLPWTAQHGFHDAVLLRPTAHPQTTPSIDAAAKSAGATDNWLAQVQRRIEQDERQIHRHLNGTLVANTQKGFRAFFSHHGIRAVPDNTEVEQQNKAPWSWHYRLHSISRGENKDANMTLLKQPKPTFDGQHVTLTHKQGIVETWENRTEGIEQTITIQTRPLGSDDTARVVLRGEHSSSLEAVSHKKSIQWKLTDHNKPVMLAYQGLVVNDAKGRQLPSGIEYTQGALNLWYDDADAVYPVVVDPLLTTSNWGAAEESPGGSSFGASVNAAGDVNGDGYSDVMVSDSRFNNTGKVYVYHGSPDGLPAQADWVSVGDGLDKASFGSSAATAGDVNGDGYSDVIVEARPNGNRKVYVYHGGPGGLPDAASWTTLVDESNGAFGLNVSSAGDVNGDGFSDIIIGALFWHRDSSLRANKGRAYVYHGGPGGLPDAASWTASVDDSSGTYGRSVSSAGDVNGDGYSDVIVGAYGFNSIGKAYIYYGSSSGLSNSADWTSSGDEQEGSRFGYSVATAGDVNGDGYSDVIIGAPQYGLTQYSLEGRAYIYYGSATGLSINHPPDWLMSSTEQTYAVFGFCVATAGDVNGDGFSDIIVGSAGYGEEAHVYLGGENGLSLAQANWVSRSVSAAGDINGDGFSDVITGDSSSGKAYLYYGAAAGLAPNATPNWEASPAKQKDAYFGEVIASAGDVNGDGYSDVIVGAPRWNGVTIHEGRAYVYHGSASGLSPGDQPNWTADATTQNIWTGLSAVAGAGDINGDGYSDVIITAVGFSSPTATTPVRMIYTYNGSKQGLSIQTSGFSYGAGQDNSSFGSSIAAAGDVNGDGYSDVIVGASGYSASALITSSGKAYVFHGSSQGLSATADWESQGDQQLGAFFASSVASAGDVNGDGYSDIIIGAPRFDFSISTSNEGKVYVYHGGPYGLSPGTSPDWTAGSAENASAWFGNSVATAGDVNGDGFSDVIIGAPMWRGTNLPAYAREGRAYVYYGSTTGLTTGSTPDWTADPADQLAAHFGSSVSSAGDVNGDGFSDIMIGAPAWDSTNPSIAGEGRAYVYLGSQNGLTPSGTPDWTIDPTDQGYSSFGSSVATAGDINGDGYSDVIINAPRWDDTNQPALSNTGKIYVYHGNQGGGLSLNPKQARMDQSTLVQRNNATGTNSVRLQMRSRVSVGRTRARMVWEIKPRGALFDGTNLSFGTWQDTTLLGTTVDEPVTGLTPGMHYHWRARMQFFPQLDYGRWVSMGPSGKNEADFLAGAIIKYATLTSLPIADPKHGQHIASNKRTPVLLRFSVRMDSIGGTLKSITLSSSNADPETQLMCDIYADGNQNGVVDDTDRILGTVRLLQGGSITGLDVAMPALSETHYIAQVHRALNSGEKAAGVINSIDAPTDFSVPMNGVLGLTLALILMSLAFFRQRFIVMHSVTRLASVLIFASIVVSAACISRSGFDTQLAIVSNTDVVITSNVGGEITVRGAPIEGVVFATGQ